MKIKEQLKQSFTAYWQFLTLNAACELDLFDAVANGFNNFDTLNQYLETNPNALHKLIGALIQLEVIKINDDKIELTEQGHLLTEGHQDTLKNACLLWAKEHLTAWQHLSYSIKTGKPSFDYLYGQPFFDYLQNKPNELKNYHKAMRDYAKDDYKLLPQIIDFSEHKSLIDLGGGLGTVTKIIADFYPNLKCCTFDLSEVIDLIEDIDKQPFKILRGDFFDSIPSTDAIVLSRILHDWKDEKALQILKNCKTALNEKGKLYVLEIMQNEIQAHLLSLNMLTICESYERTFSEYQVLLNEANFKIIDIKPLNALQTILICE